MKETISAGCRQPIRQLQPFVLRLWVSGPRQVVSPRELCLPSGVAHIAIRIGDAPVRLWDESAGKNGIELGTAVLGGPRCQAYLKDVSVPCGSVGASFRPGAIHHLCREHAASFAERHFALESIWGGAAARLTVSIQEERDPGRRMDLLESFLLARLSVAQGLHPAIAGSLVQLAGGRSVAEVVQASGFSHRHFVSLFRREVGLTPKLYGRVVRFQRAIRLLEQGYSLVATAVRAGYADQPHFTREFNSLSGIAPGRYASLAPSRPLHVPFGGGQFFSRR